MKNSEYLKYSLVTAGAVLFFSACSQFHRVPPGQSLGEAMAARADLVALPSPPSPSLEEIASADALALAYAGPAVEPELPAMDLDDVPSAGIEIDDPTVFLVKGDQLREKGDRSGAIRQYEDAVGLDPNFSLAWRNLALAYQEAGNDEKAMEAFRHYKDIAGN